MTLTKKVAILILNWNGWRDTIECLDSVYQINYPDYDVIVIDNHSFDESVSKIISWAKKKDISCISVIKEQEIHKSQILQSPNNGKCPSNKRLTLVLNRRNYGFGGGNNIGIKYAMLLNFDYILLLNNDTIVTPSFLNTLVEAFNTERDIGIVGPKILYWNYFGRRDVIWFGGGWINFKTGRIGHYKIDKKDNPSDTAVRDVDYITGCAMLVKQEVFKKIGLFDERFFMYVEDVDFCIRTKNAGYKIKYVPTSKIYHKVSASLGGNVSPSKIYYKYKSTILLFRKHGMVKPKSMLSLLYTSLIFVLSIFRRKRSMTFPILISLLHGLFDGVRQEI